MNPQEEQAIIQVTQELISRLEARDLNPKIVIARGARSLDPQISKDRVFLPFTLYDKLTHDEWRPLIVSKLIYYRNTTKKDMLVALSYPLFPFLTILLLAPLSILGIGPILSETVASGLILLWVLAMYPVSKVVYAPFFQRLQQTADKQTLELSLSPTLEYALRKIELLTSHGSRGKKAVEKRIRSFVEST